MDTPHTQMWLCLLLFLLSLVSATSGSIYIVRQLRLLQGICRLTVIRKRYPDITNVVVYISLFCFVTVCLQTALIAYKQQLILTTTSLYTALRIVCSSLNLVCFQCLLYLQVLRFWLMYFDVRYTISSLEREWTVYLDLSQTQKNWFFSNIETYGSIRWLLPRLAGVCFASTTVCVATNTLITLALLPTYADVLILVLNLAPVLVHYRIHAQTPTFYDHYYMRDEMRSITHLFLVYLVLEMARVVTKSKASATISMDMDVVHSLLLCVELFTIGALCFMCTAWVVHTISAEYGSYVDAQESVANRHQESAYLPTTEFRFIYMPPTTTTTTTTQLQHSIHNHHNKQHRHPNDDDEKKAEADADDDIRLPYPAHRTNKNLEDIEISKKLKLAQILSCNESFTLFQQHLARESASSYKNVACLLSFVEYVQFKQLLKDTLPAGAIHAGTFGKFKLASSIPQSSVVHENLNHNLGAAPTSEELLREYKGRAYHLYCKYIKDDAELRLRLPHEQRQVLENQMHELDKLINSEMDADCLFRIFDDVLICQYEIMWKSYQRFVNSSDYLLVQEFFQQRQQKEKKKKTRRF